MSGEGTTAEPGAGGLGSDVTAAVGEPAGVPVVRSSRKRTHRPEARRRRVLVRFDEAEYADLVVAGNRAGLSPTAFVGVAAMAAARGTEVPGSPLREALSELMQARTAAVRIGVAVNKLAAKALAGATVTPAELDAASKAAARSVVRLEAAAELVHRRLA